MNVHKDVQLLVGPWILAFAETLKSEPITLDPVFHFMINGKFIEDRTLRVHYAAGITCDVLNDWINSSLIAPESIHIYAAGDDCLIMYYLNGEWFVIEGDASKFDSTISSGPLDFELYFLKECGMPEIYRTMLDDSFGTILRGKFADQRIRISRENRPLRNTGGPDTSFGNTIVMLYSWVLYFLDNPLNLDPSEFFRNRLGFNMKIKILKFADCTFLKGYFAELGPRWVWTPLPSRLFKLVKSLRDPRTIYKKVSLEEALTTLVGDISYSISRMPLDPVLRTWVNKTAQFHGDADVDLDWSYSLEIDQYFSEDPDFESCMRFITNRYSVSRDLVIMFMNSMSQWRYHSTVWHPFLQRMLEVDY